MAGGCAPPATVFNAQFEVNAKALSDDEHPVKRLRG